MKMQVNNRIHFQEEVLADYREAVITGIDRNVPIYADYPRLGLDRNREAVGSDHTVKKEPAVRDGPAVGRRPKLGEGKRDIGESISLLPFIHVAVCFAGLY
jgi:hypothetical protein